MSSGLNETSVSTPRRMNDRSPNLDQQRNSRASVRSERTLPSLDSPNAEPPQQVQKNGKVSTPGNRSDPRASVRSERPLPTLEQLNRNSRASVRSERPADSTPIKRSDRASIKSDCVNGVKWERLPAERSKSDSANIKSDSEKLLKDRRHHLQRMDASDTVSENIFSLKMDILSSLFSSPSVSYCNDVASVVVVVVDIYSNKRLSSSKCKNPDCIRQLENCLLYGRFAKYSGMTYFRTIFI
jgi:hypothetical protein